ncbi:50S ribosomal protein L6 [Eubacteriales bacterium OttesenSCG-928-M02]|nr:50S ribosomal protein L6 [Eubacteriales bacterium OttesenSCG-928-M02]
MSRIGKMPINLPQGVSITVEGDNTVKVKGPKGELSEKINPDMTIAVDGDVVTVSRPTDQKEHRSLHGLSRTLINNMVVGVSEGYTKALEIVGVGYRAQLQGKKLLLNMGYSHPVEMEPIPGIDFEVPAPTRIVVSGIDKQLVGETAARIRRVRKPEPYKGKGIRYEGEYVRRKAGKTGM